jgi:hypothetical protein
VVLGLVDLRRWVVGAIAVGFLAVPAADATTTAARTTGAVGVSLKYGHGRAKISWRGSLLGWGIRGRIVATDNVVVRNWSSRVRLTDNVTAYRGSRMTVRVYGTSGLWRIKVKGRGINVSGVVRGSLTLNGVDTGRTGKYSIAGADFRPWPRVTRTFTLHD